jgi:hypothetical protein
MRKRSSKSLAKLLAPLPGSAQAKAREKVGSSSLDRLRWFLELLNRLPETADGLTENERKELEAEVVAFCEAIGAVVGGRDSRLSFKAATDVVRQTREQIFAMFHGSTSEMQMPEITFAFSRNSRSFYMGEPPQIFPWAIAKLIETEGHRIAMCARSGCGKLFARRKRGRYCSVKCAQVEHFARYVARHSS